MPGIPAEPKPSVAASLCDRSRCLDADNLKGLGELQGPPVFILGHHRSGTTMLYELLERTKSFNIITAYHAVCYDCLLTHAQRGESDTSPFKVSLCGRLYASEQFGGRDMWVAFVSGAWGGWFFGASGCFYTRLI
jgi:hypothetical protein